MRHLIIDWKTDGWLVDQAVRLFHADFVHRKLDARALAEMADDDEVIIHQDIKRFTQISFNDSEVIHGRD